MTDHLRKYRRRADGRLVTDPNYSRDAAAEAAAERA
jgi:hypothetical protein